MPTELKSAPAVNPLKTKYLFSAGAPYGTSEGTERFPAKTLEFTNAAAGEQRLREPEPLHEGGDRRRADAPRR